MARLAEIWPLFLGGALGGLAALLAGLPMPFMLGGISGAGGAVLWIEARQGPRDMRLPPLMRKTFIAVIGIMIGASFSPDLMRAMPAFWPTALAILAFIVVAQLGGYLIMRRLGGYAPADALFASMPGGLIEASILGEKAGADPRLVSVQHFIRIILVVFSVPLLFWLVTGTVVGSASGQTFEAAAPARWWDAALILALVPLGLAAGRWTRLPAAHLMGPMIFSAALHVSGLVDLSAPPWMLHLAQLVVGVGLGAQFSGLTGAMLLRGLGTGLAAVAFMMALSFGFALALAPAVPASTPALFLSFAPGGVTEMSLIALSLQLSPVIVAVHHLVRIIFTVLITNAIARRIL